MTPTDEQLERWAAEVVMEYESCPCGDGYKIGGPDQCKIFRPLTDLNQCFQVVEKMRKKGWPFCEIFMYPAPEQDSGYMWWCKFWKEEGKELYGFSPNPARAILLAAWQALEGKED